MKNLIFAAFLLVPHLASARRPVKRVNNGSYAMNVNFFKCSEAASGLCAKEVKDGGGGLPYVSYRTDVVFQVGHCPEFSSKILERMQAASIDTLGATIAGFTITGNGFSSVDELVITGLMP